jgi:hypothetical protein
MSSFNLPKTISEKKAYVIVGVISIIQGECSMKSGKRSGTERMSEMTLRSAGDKNEERKAVIAKETRNNLKDAALDSGSVALIKTINDDQASRSRCIEISRLKRLTQRLDNEGSGLGFQGSTEDEWVSVNGSNHLLPRPGDVDRDLVGNCSDKGFGVTACGIGTREEETGEK